MSKAEKLYKKMSRTKGGWGAKDLETLYTGFGFVKDERAKHTMYTHPRHSRLRTMVGRHTNLADGYIETALEMIGELLKLEKG